MVLAHLGSSITRALVRMSSATVVDEKALGDCLNEITRALLQSDVRFETVRGVQANIRNIVSLDTLAAGTNKRRIIQRAVFSELCAMLDPGKPAFVPTKANKPSVVMFVGLQGSGKTTTCAKYARHYHRKGFRPSLVCADTFRAGAFDQLKQNATKARIPFYGSYMESDPVKIAVKGLETLRKEGSDLIIIDTSGRHKQEAALFEEMRQVAQATKPDLVIFVMDASIGQAAFGQAQAFKQSVSVGAVIVTKMDGHANGGGALSAVAATKSPVIFIGTGEHMDNLEVFDVKPFVSRLLGMGDVAGLIHKIQDVVMPAAAAADDQHQQPDNQLLAQLAQGGTLLTLRSMYEQFQYLLKMGPIGQLLSMLPGFTSELMAKGQDKEGQAKIKRYMTIMDSMTDAELDSTNPKLMNESRVIRVARGSGRQVKDVRAMLEEYKRLAKMWSKMKIPKNGKMSHLTQNMNIQHLIKNLPPQVLKQVGGIGGLQALMKQMGGNNDMTKMDPGGDRPPSKRR
uniref:Uncharacterized protein n=1 Tax=Avena sativa TaxID=4498 RepID=A0ACD5ULL2_AVESA